MKEIASEDRATVTDDTPSRLHSTWLSEECEVRAGPEYIVRKYSFFANGTFLLLRYYYAEESCSIATYTVVARGSIEISSASIAVPGATEANVQLDSIRLIPFDRQVVHKFERKLNASCGGIETKWRTYTTQLIYERPSTNILSNASLHDLGLNSNSFQSRLPRPRNRGTLGCLKFLGIEFTELELLRVERRRFDPPTNIVGPLNRNPADADRTRTRVELLLGRFGRSGRSGISATGSRRPDRLQSAALLRADTASGCLICGSVLRATELSPPLFHQAPPLPAVIDGLWLSVKCESVDQGFWSRRFFRTYSGGNRWSARWTYYADSACSIPLYTIIVAGTYVQRPVRRERDTFERENVRFERVQKSLIPESNVYRRVTRDSKEPTIGSVARLGSTDRITLSLARKHATLLSGMTLLELRVTESRSIPVDTTASTRCLAATKRNRRATGNSWPKNCVLRTVEAPAVLTFKARVGLDWNGNYILLLASWKDDFWEAPLRRCSETISQNYFQTNTGTRRSESLQGLQFSSQTYERRGRYWFSSSAASCLLESSSSLLRLTMLLLLLWSTLCSLSHLPMQPSTLNTFTIVIRRCH
ncbi:uncharacterized protein LOC143343139 [Colletes latitarsis]|uniref:uncharacterized protein LOC143343139 n=1 Tax=Colletes latitarsis TaxID=2605962 RepID=UPI00403742F5